MDVHLFALPFSPTARVAWFCAAMLRGLFARRRRVLSRRASFASRATPGASGAAPAAYLRARRDAFAADDAAAARAGRPWRTTASVVVSRLPTVTPEPPAWQTAFETAQADYEDKLGLVVPYPDNYWNLEAEEEEMETAAQKAEHAEAAKAADAAAAAAGEDGNSVDEDDNNDDGDTVVEDSDDDTDHLDLGLDDDLDDLDLDLSATSDVSSSDFDKVWSNDGDGKDGGDDEQQEVVYDTFGGYMFQGRTTRADERDNRTSLNRKLDERLYLLVRSDDTGGRWTFPGRGAEVPVPEPMVVDHTRRSARRDRVITTRGTLRDAALQDLSEQCGKPLERAITPQNGGAPVGFNWRVFSEDEQQRTGAFGEKVFYFKAQIFEQHGKAKPRVKVSGKDGEHVWVTRAEFPEYLTSTGEEADERFATFAEHLCV